MYENHQAVCWILNIDNLVSSCKLVDTLVCSCRSVMDRREKILENIADKCTRIGGNKFRDLGNRKQEKKKKVESEYILSS